MVKVNSRSRQGHVRSQGHSQGQPLKSNFTSISEGHRFTKGEIGQGQGYFSRSNPQIDPLMQCTGCIGPGIVGHGSW